MGEILKAIANETDKTIIGVSAGGIVLTPDISNAKAPNDFGLTDYRGLGLVEFVLFPHFEEEDACRLEAIREFLANSNTDTAYALPEYSVLVVEDGKVTPLGAAYLIDRQSKKLQILS